MTKFAFATVAAAGLAAAVLAGCNPRTADMQQSEHVRAAEDAQIEAVAAEDADGAAALYAPDAIMFNPFEAPLTGPEAIRAGFQQLFDDPNGALVATPGEVFMAASGDYAVSTGTAAITATDPETQTPQTIEVTYMTLWRRQDDDSWKIVRDMATPGAQSAPAAASTEP